MKKRMLALVLVAPLSVSVMALAGCSTGVRGEQILGMVGSPAWFKTASNETIVAHYPRSSFGMALS
jgi:hypothetical protein